MDHHDRAVILLNYASSYLAKGSKEVGTLLLREARRVMDEYIQAPLQYLDLVVQAVKLTEEYEIAL